MLRPRDPHRSLRDVPPRTATNAWVYVEPTVVFNKTLRNSSKVYLSLFLGVVLVISEKSACVWNLRPGLVGLRLLIATFSPIHQTIQ